MTTLTDAEQTAMWYADGETLATVSLSGAALREIDPTSPDFLPPAATTEERVDAARRALFKIAVYCMDRKLAVESNLTKRWSKLPDDAPPPQIAYNRGSARTPARSMSGRRSGENGTMHPGQMG